MLPVSEIILKRASFSSPPSPSPSSFQTNTLLEHTFVLSHKSLTSWWISIKVASAVLLCMLYLWNNFQLKASTWMYLTSTAIMVHNKGNFEKVISHNFFKLSLNIHTSIWFMYLQFYANHLFVVYAMRIINQQCRITLHLFIFTKSSDILNKNTLGVKKVRGQEAAL